MNRDEIFEKVNELLADTDYPAEIKEISDLEDFLNDEGNSEYEVYDEIEGLYNELLEGSDVEDD